MAAEVPAKDVLCEAMEYLAKLGSNLRTRSENLQEKKIRRDRLNNVLAVQKAASKVLLICELSKKSLENVESGVRKVLKLVDTSQASSNDGGKKSESRKGSEITSRAQKNDKKDYHYFEYRSRKLRIKNRISFKHYSSVRVYAKSLPKSMLDKYPVHHDCKLYRMRKKQERQQRVKDEARSKKNQDDNEVSGDNIPDNLDSKSPNLNNIETDIKNKENNISVISIPDSPESKVGFDKESLKSTADKRYRRESSVDSTKERSVSGVRNKFSRKNKSEQNSSKNRERYHSKSRNSSDEEEHIKKSNKRKRVLINDSSSDDDGDRKTSKDNDSEASCHENDSKKKKLNEESDNDTKLSNDKNKTENNMDKNDDIEVSQKPIIKCVSLSKLLKPDALEKEVKHGPHSEPKKSSNEGQSQQKINNKPGVLEKEEVRRGPHSKPKKISNERLSPEKVNDTKQNKTSEEQAKEEEEYWILKRKEVTSFKPKSFVLNVTRLPEMSKCYLKKLNLRKITQGGITVCDIATEESDKEKQNESSDNDENEVNFKKKDKESEKSESKQPSSASSSDNALIEEANRVKSSLLCESDSDDELCSDKGMKSSKNDTQVIKKLLLNDSDSDHKKSDNASHRSNDEDKVADADQAQKAKNALCKESDSESDKNEPKTTRLGEKVTNLLNTESDLDSGNCRLVFESGSDSEKINKATENEAADAKVTSDDKDVTKDTNSDIKDSVNIVEKNDENKSQCQENERTPEKKSPCGSDVNRSSNDSSDDKTRTPLSKRLTPQSKKRRMRESMHAKKMLLTYSSSDTEDEQLTEALKEIKAALLHGSDEESKEKQTLNDSSHSSSGEDIIQKTKACLDSAKVRTVKDKKKKQRRKHVSEDSSDKSDTSKSSNSKMVRSKSKPGNSSCQVSDAPDSNDKDIDGLANLKSLNKPRRRISSSSAMSEESNVNNGKSKKPKSKPTGLISGEILKAESSSESVEVSAEENVDDDIPEVTLPSFNGVSDHLVKEDLLGESDSSGSQNEDDKSGIKEDSDAEEELNARRRKPHLLSSDSEVGSSRKKNSAAKMSDFEESDDSGVNKRSKRKKKLVDSDASVGSTSSNEGGKKKRRRIKSVRESDISGSESETEGRNKHGRKNIRKVMGKNQLEEATKKAAREEKERIARIADRQKMYNNLEFDETGKPDEVVLDKVILDFEPDTKEPLIEVDRGLVKKLKPHQANGIKFMWDACFESVKRIKKDRGSGCILAHCMGLGKTLQVVTLTHTLLTHGDLTNVNRVLVVCPLSTVLNWVNEFKMWLKYAEKEFEVDVYELSRYKQNSERAFQLSQWFRHGGVCVLGYEMFRNLSADNSKKYKKKMLKNFQEALVDPGPDLVVCDEGHLLKNEKTSLSQSMNKVKTYRRIVLTGTPLQNNLKEYYCMVQFVKPNLLGKYNEYLNRFVNPITNGQYTDSTEHDIKIMKRRSHVLHKMLDGAVQRRDYGVLAPFLPPKHEYVLFITLSDVQTKLYQHYLDNFSRRPLPGKSSGFLFPDFQSLQRIWTHPLVLKYNSERYEIMQQKKRDKEEEEDSEGSLRDFIDDDSTSEESMTDDSTDDSSDVSDDSRKKSKKKKKKSSKKSKGKDKEIKEEGGQSRPRRGTRANPVEIDDEDKDDDIIEMKNENPTEWWIKLVTDEEIDDMRNSHKLVLLFDILRQCDTIGDKLLVFSQSLYSLDLIEHFLGKVDDATQEGRIDEKLGGHIGTWSPGVDYFRLDGSTSCENRSIWCKNFNREDNPRARLFLISTRAGGLGINLVAANRVVIFDVSWNPSHDVQSIFRVYRFGQKKPCYVYRFLAMGTMEEKIYERQVTKQAISKRVIDEQQIDRHYAENDLAELYKFEPQPPTPRPIPPLPKDRLFAEMLREHEAQIYKYHEHDSLLENKEEETLSEEERKAAWEDFENEKNRPPPAPFPSAWQANLLQQQQLTYAAVAAMLRKDMPNVSDNQLRDMIPLIYNANPQLMQKLSEMYKYSPAMMTPGMMNPGVMNAAGVGGALGMGGASGLQYEPPWQRQQQQQQQMRLQQLLQHQNPMGAKFYAGGLGSRDPIAMALQHQRSREIMMGTAAGGAGAGAGRPRGRPPMQPLAPPSGDVVNLDSD